MIIGLYSVEIFFILEGSENCFNGTEVYEEKICKPKVKLVLTIDTSLYVHIKEFKTIKAII